MLGDDAPGPPRFLVRVDEFPHYQAWDEPARFGTDGFERFHTILTEAGVPYCIAVPPRVSRRAARSRRTAVAPLDDRELEVLQRIERDGVTLALHGRDHRTRHASPRRRSELTGLDATATAALLDGALAELAAAGLARPEVFVPPYNRFDADQYASARRALRRRLLGARDAGDDGLPAHAAVARRRALPPVLLAALRPRARGAARGDRAHGHQQGDLGSDHPALGLGVRRGLDQLEALVAQIAPAAAHWEQLLALVRPQ